MSSHQHWAMVLWNGTVQFFRKSLSRHPRMLKDMWAGIIIAGGECTQLPCYEDTSLHAWCARLVTVWNKNTFSVSIVKTLYNYIFLHTFWLKHFFFSPEVAVKARIELIKTKALEVYQDMLSKAQQAYKDMNMWLGARFLAEMSR